jgi:hypothetical protein
VGSIDRALGEQESGFNFVRLGEIERLAELAASYWHSIALTADRGEVHLLALHCKHVALVTKSAFALVREIGDAS